MSTDTIEYLFRCICQFNRLCVLSAMVTMKNKLFIKRVACLLKFKNKFSKRVTNLYRNMT